ncbi:helix-turn-helix domain-containing protein [Nonomuraea angiospora]|uniref:helix-turn-helix domain-containing protein n=1 Tax=Nonomuraea angiospora TaxID=46172 RepID=UPI0029A4EE9C|nr:helix-turn-helix domain-containing protein [Nonomuraea angiospora]MDX3111192.1 helix-turn-helix domain containing protein [Nonomuraea angiospora]
MAERVRVREIDDDEGRRLLRIVRRGTGSVVTWRRAQVVLLSAQGMPVGKIAEVTFTSADRVRDVLHNFNADGFGALPEVHGRAAQDVHAARAARDQEDRQVQACASRWPA